MTDTPHEVLTKITKFVGEACLQGRVPSLTEYMDLAREMESALNENEKLRFLWTALPEWKESVDGEHQWAYMPKHPNSPPPQQEIDLRQVREDNQGLGEPGRLPPPPESDKE